MKVMHVYVDKLMYVDKLFMEIEKSYKRTYENCLCYISGCCYMDKTTLSYCGISYICWHFNL